MLAQLRQKRIVALLLFFSVSIASLNFYLRIDQLRVEDSFSQPKPSGKTPTPLIPRNLLFVETRHSTIDQLPKLFYENIQKTARHYRDFWNETEAPLHFMGDAECQAALNATEPALLPYYRKEKRGQNFSNLCRMAALYLHGGYYFDTDMESVTPVALPPGVTFSTVVDPDNKQLFNSFVATTPKHPIVKEALQVMLSYYRGTVKLRSVHMGTSTLMDAFLNVPESQRGTVWLMHEYEFTKHTLYQHLPRRKGVGCCCNYIVVGPTNQVHFYSRIVGAGGHCALPKNRTRTDPN